MLLHTLIPDTKTLLSLEPEELAGPLLECLKSSQGDHHGLLNRGTITSQSNIKNYPTEDLEKISKVIMEAWFWLEKEGLIAPQPGTTVGDWFFITRRGLNLKNSSDFEAFKNAIKLPKELLHKTISSKAWSPFLRGEYDTSVFQSFKEVEVAVRKAGGFDLTDLGVDLMRKAFNPKTGSLTDEKAPDGEKESIAHLFAGAIGLIKNPHSHRNEPITEATEAFEMLMLASHLLRIVDIRSKEIV